MIRKSILAGVFISIGGIVNLQVGGVYGAFLFSFGLIAVCLYGLKLYTGTAGFINNLRLRDNKNLFKILFWNVVGCLIMSMYYSNYKVVELDDLVYSRIVDGPWRCFCNAVLCGLIMTTVVEFYRSHKTLIPIIIGIPVFILSGFNHSIADAFYFLCFDDWSFNLLWIWICEVMGNYIGCSIYTLTLLRHEV